MNSFSYVRAGDLPGAVRELVADGETKLIAGGTNLLDLMKENVERPGRLVDITRLPLREIQPGEDGVLRLGALVTNTDVAYHEQIEERYPLLSRAILAGASPQLRNMATVGGNLMQRTRCYYYSFSSLLVECGARQLGRRDARNPSPSRSSESTKSSTKSTRGSGGLSSSRGSWRRASRSGGTTAALMRPW